MMQGCALLLVVAGTAVPGLGGDVIFTDAWESGTTCSWASEATACGVGTELVITLPGDAVTMTLVYIPPGTFWMGSPEDERGRSDWEDLHEVTLTRGCWMGKYEVTQAQWQAVMGSLPDLACGYGPHGAGPDYPVYCITRDEITGPDGFISRLTTFAGIAAFRLPTEAEWEHAARAGAQTRFSHGGVLECNDECGPCATHSHYMWWCGDQPTSTSHPVGSRQANLFGMYDMHGNVEEWVQDWWQFYLGTAPVVDPTGPPTGSSSVFRGGAWSYPAALCRSADRYFGDPLWRYEEIGFRLAMTAD